MQSIEQGKFAPTLPLKNLAGALLFTVFLGPLGLLYASSLGGIVMLFVAFVVGCTKLFVPFMLVWLGCSIWSVIAVNRYNDKIMNKITEK